MTSQVDNQKNNAMKKSEPNRNDRKRYLIDNRVQGQLVRRIVGYFALFILMGSALGFLVQFLSDPFLGWSEHVERLWNAQGPYLAVLVAMTPIFVYDMIKTSNRFAGPIYRLRNSIGDLKAGNEYVPVKIRSNDFWHELMDEYNELIEQLIDKKESPSSADTAESNTTDEEKRDKVDEVLEAISNH